MSLRRVLSIAISLLVLGLSPGLSLVADASPVNVAGRSIEALIPSGYCPLEAYPAETELVNLVKKALGNTNQLLVMFAACKELDEFRKGKRVMLDNFGQILAQTTNGQLRELKGVSRSEYIKELSAQVGVVPVAAKEAEARLKKITPAYRGQEHLGLLAIDANGVYFGHLTVLSDEAGRPRSMAGVTALTIVKELSFSINMYEAYTKLPDLRGLIAREQAATANFVRANGN